MTDQKLPELEQREHWGSRTGFILAAIGSAVGLGNLWGFPYKLYKYGGGAFLIPYIIAMVVIGIPILILELSLGQRSQQGAPSSFRQLGRRKEMIGWWALIMGLIILSYYPVVMAWCLSYFGRAVHGICFNGGVLPLASAGKDAAAQASTAFFQDYANMWTSADGVPSWTLGTLSVEIAHCVALVWVLMFLCVFRGVNVVGKVVLWTVPLPWIMLIILAVRGLTMPGASRGLAYYLNPDWTQLAKPDTWRFAFGQVFFSMSLGFGVMMTYASFLRKKSDVNNNATVIGLGDLGTSFIAGVAIFAILGAMSLTTNQPVTETVKEGVGLAFVAFPYALSQLPHSAWFAMVFFFALITLGIDSGFSILEAIVTGIVDRTRWNRVTVLCGVCFFGLVAGLMYTARGGISWIGAVDGLVNGPWGIVLAALLQCVVIGWGARLDTLRAHANAYSDWKLGSWWEWNIRLFAPMVLMSLLAWMVYDSMSGYNPATGLGWIMTQGPDGQHIVNLPVLITLIIAAACPLIAIAISKWLTDKTRDDAHHPQTAHSSAGTWAGLASSILALGAAGYVFCGVVRATWNVNSESASPLAPLAGTTAGICVAAILAAAGLVISSRHLVISQRRGLLPSQPSQWGGVIGTVAIGVAVASLLSRAQLHTALSPAPVASDTAAVTEELTTGAYIMLTVMFSLIVGGLGFCFLKAIKPRRTQTESAT